LDHFFFLADLDAAAAMAAFLGGICREEARRTGCGAPGSALLGGMMDNAITAGTATRIRFKSTKREVDVADAAAEMLGRA
jgi:hypothetical protein